MTDEYIFKNFKYSADNLDTDLACERRRADVTLPGVEYRTESGSIGSWERISIRSEEGAQSIGRPIGTYDTLTLPKMDTLDDEDIRDATEEVARELCRLCDKGRISPYRILVVGLGNRHLTPDAVGPECAEMVRATMHIRELDESLFESMECSEIAVLKPGVTAESGIDTLDIVKGVCDRISPDVIFAVDALAAKSPTRLGTTVQIASTGLFPGSGLGNRRGAITEGTLGVPVISIGVPTVINSRMFVMENGEARAAKQNEGMFLSPKDINEVVTNAAKIISGGINQAFGFGF